jgi:hypothetical protein
LACFFAQAGKTRQPLATCHYAILAFSFKPLQDNKKDFKFTTLTLQVGLCVVLLPSFVPWEQFRSSRSELLLTRSRRTGFLLHLLSQIFDAISRSEIL